MLRQIPNTNLGRRLRPFAAVGGGGLRRMYHERVLDHYNNPNRKIVDACFKTFGCGSAIISPSVATELVKRREIEEALKLKNTDIAKHLSLQPVKLHCSMLAEDAIKAAVKDYEAKRPKVNASQEAADA